LHPEDRFGPTPEGVEVIIIALLGAEDVHDNVAVIEQEPARVQRTFLMMGQDAVLFQTQFNVFKDGADLALAVTSTEDEIVRKTTEVADIQQNDIAGLLIAGDFHGAAGYIDTFQSLNLPGRYFLNYTTGRRDTSRFSIQASSLL
jgi:hypothetical protein